jgi:hypothetical protein
MNEHLPDIELRFYLVEYGYQVDIFDAHVELGTICRDFGGSYPIDNIIAQMIGGLPAYMRDVERRLKETRAL